MPTDSLRRFVNLFAVLVALAVNILFDAVPPDGLGYNALYDSLDLYFSTARYVYSILVLIYIGWLAFVIYQFRASRKADARLRRLGYWFALSCILNAAWIITWHFQLFAIGVIAMLALLAALTVCYIRMDVSRSGATGPERWCLDIPFGAYLGWVAAAAMLNVASYLQRIGWDRLGLESQTWTVVLLALAGALGLLVAIRRYDPAFLAVLAWVIAGIAVAHIQTRPIAFAAWFAALFCLALSMVSIVRQNPSTADS